MTDKGYREAGTIKVGDTLFDRDGKPTTVIGVFPQGEQPLYQISFTDRKSLVTDGQHLNVIVRRGGRKEQLISTEDLFQQKHLWNVAGLRGRNRARFPSVKPIQMPEREQYIPAYTMGALLGDGGLTQTIIFSGVDAEIIDRIRDELPPELEIVRKNGTNCDYNIKTKDRLHTKEGYSFNPFTSYLRGLGLMGKRSEEKSIPDNYKYGSVEQRLNLLRGLMDTDGCIISKNETKTGRCIQFYSTSKQLAEDVIWLVESLGGKAWSLVKKTPKLPCHIINVILPTFNPFYLPRKAEKYFVHENTTDKVIKSVERIAPGKSVCFKVDSPSETFVAANQIVTHNTRVGSVWMKVKNHTYTDPSDNFLIVAPTYKILTQSTLPPYLAIMRDVGTFNKADMTLKIHGGGTVYMRSGTDPDSIVGITNIRAVWGDEAGLFSLYFSENIAARAAFKAAQTLYTTSPYALNWIFKDIIRPKMKNQAARPDVTLVQAASWENPYFPKDVIERNRATMDPRRFNAMFGGKWEKMTGLVYDCFDEVDNTCEPFELPVGTRVVAGVDWGFTAPFALTVRAITPTGHHYQLSEVYKTGLSMSQRVDIARQKKQIFGIKIFWCDPEEPAAIKEFNENGLPAAPADNDIRAGVDAHYELVKTRRYKVFRGQNPYTMDEYEAYHYPAPDDLGPDDAEKEQKPVSQSNHAMDSNRYISLMERKTMLRTGPGTKLPGDTEKKEDQFDRLERLKRKPRNNHSEKWS